MKTKIEQLRKWIAESKRMVFFGGAGSSGVSVSSATETPSSRANPIRLFKSGAERSVSHLLTA